MSFIDTGVTSYGSLTGDVFPKAVYATSAVPAANKARANDYNIIGQCLLDTRAWLHAGEAKFYGMTEQASDPAPSGLGGIGQPGYFWPKTDHTVHYHVNGADGLLGGTSLPNAYTTGTAGPQVLGLDGTRLGVIIRDNASPIATTLFAVQNSGASSSYLSVTTTGVGAGVAAPVTAAHVKGTLRLSGTATDRPNEIAVDPADGQDGLIIRTRGNVVTLIDSDNTALNFCYWYRNTTGTTPLMALDGNASLPRLGINTATPSSIFHAVSTDSATSFVRVDNTAQTIMGSTTSGTTAGFVGTLSNHPFIVRTNNTTRVNVDTTGLTTITGTSGNIQLVLQGASAQGGGMRIFPFSAAVASAGVECHETSDLTVTNYSRFFIHTNFPIATAANVCADAGGTGTPRDIVFTTAVAHVERFRISATGNITATPGVFTSGAPTSYLFTGAAHTGLTASTEALDVNFNLARTVQHATGDLATQRAFLVQAPTYSFVGASTLTSAATFAVSGAPVAGTNATLTNAYAIWAQSGRSQFDGSVGFKAHANFLGSSAVKSTGAVQTTDATQTTAFTFTLADTTLYWFTAKVIGRDTSGTDRAFYVIQARCHREGGGATLGTVNALFTDETNAAWDATFTVSSNSIRVSVTGAAATTINWVCEVGQQAVSGNS